MKLQGTGNPLVKSQSKLYLFYRKMSRKGGYLFDIPLKKPSSVTVHEIVPFLCIPSQVPQASSFPSVTLAARAATSFSCTSEGVCS